MGLATPGATMTVCRVRRQRVPGYGPLRRDKATWCLKSRHKFFVCKIKQAGACKIKAEAATTLNRNRGWPIDRQQRVRTERGRARTGYCFRKQGGRRSSAAFHFHIHFSTSIKAVRKAQKVSIYTTSSRIKHHKAIKNQVQERPYFNAVTKIP